MAFGGFNEGGAAQPMAEINTTPLVDVMLVLLVIFIITAPLFQQALPVDLPRVSASPLDEKPATLRVAVNGAGVIHLDNEPMELAALVARLARVERPETTEVHLYADRDTRYERVAEVLAAAQQAGLLRIAFVTEPVR